jgi:hypothetical protein
MTSLNLHSKLESLVFTVGANGADKLHQIEFFEGDSILCVGIPAWHTAVGTTAWHTSQE